MKTWHKIAIGVGAAAAIGGVVWVSVYQANKDVVTVQTGKVGRQDIVSLVTASGEIRPKTYTNVQAEGFGKISEIVVKEGDRVKKGAVLAHLESIQPAADVAAQQAGVGSSEAGIKASEANYRSTQATLQQRQADLEKAKFDWQRGQDLYKAQLIAKQDYDARKSTYDGAVAGVEAAQAQLQQVKASMEQSRDNMQQNRAMLARSADILRKTIYTAPIDGLITYIAVRVGESVVPGIQNSSGSFLMTISDMSVVNTEVKVDETDITTVKNGQVAEVNIDAIPGKTFQGHVTEVGDQAILRSSGLATTQTTANTQEARDFKVVITLDNPPDGVRPGLSATAKIKTAEKKAVVSIPIQALAVRSQKDLQEADAKGKGKDQAGMTLAASKAEAPDDASKKEVQGVFVIRGSKAAFVPVQTGITGVTDIEVTSGLQAGDEIITGSYKVLRTLRPNTTIKVDNAAPKHDDQSS
jgi:HlyD family secretion protein